MKTPIRKVEQKPGINRVSCRRQLPTQRLVLASRNRNRANQVRRYKTVRRVELAKPRMRVPPPGNPPIVHVKTRIRQLMQPAPTRTIRKVVLPVAVPATPSVQSLQPMQQKKNKQQRHLRGQEQVHRDHSLLLVPHSPRLALAPACQTPTSALLPCPRPRHSHLVCRHGSPRAPPPLKERTYRRLWSWHPTCRYTTTGATTCWRTQGERGRWPSGRGPPPWGTTGREGEQMPRGPGAGPPRGVGSPARTRHTRSSWTRTRTSEGRGRGGRPGSTGARALAPGTKAVVGLRGAHERSLRVSASTA